MAKAAAPASKATVQSKSTQDKRALTKTPTAAGKTAAGRAAPTPDKGPEKKPAPRPVANEAGAPKAKAKADEAKAATDEVKKGKPDAKKGTKPDDAKVDPKKPLAPGAPEKEEESEEAEPDFGDEPSGSSSGAAPFDSGEFDGSAGHGEGSEHADDALAANAKRSLDPPLRPFANLPPLPDDLADAVERLKLVLLRHKADGWRDIACADFCAVLEAMKELALAPSNN